MLNKTVISALRLETSLLLLARTMSGGQVIGKLIQPKLESSRTTMWSEWKQQSHKQLVHHLLIQWLPLNQARATSTKRNRLQIQHSSQQPWLHGRTLH